MGGYLFSSLSTYSILLKCDFPLWFHSELHYIIQVDDGLNSVCFFIPASHGRALDNDPLKLRETDLRFWLIVEWYEVVVSLGSVVGIVLYLMFWFGEKIQKIADKIRNAAKENGRKKRGMWDICICSNCGTIQVVRVLIKLFQLLSWLCDDLSFIYAIVL